MLRRADHALCAMRNVVLTPHIGGATYDVDFTSARVSPSAPQHSYRCVTSRSYHPGGGGEDGFIPGPF